ncbi:MAG: hypothetical protein RBR77_05050 [Thauera sp.]|jgi:hypothetical protein|nr:hypothetical protein [Thauera sp.]
MGKRNHPGTQIVIARERNFDGPEMVLHAIDIGKGFFAGIGLQSAEHLLIGSIDRAHHICREQLAVGSADHLFFRAPETLQGMLITPPPAGFVRLLAPAA